jgi:hypothetical protein
LLFLACAAGVRQVARAAQAHFACGSVEGSVFFFQNGSEAAILKEKV